ncbi:MAG TPA: type II toxin-antitoxin system HicA family toxin [Gemmataceae bacterium]|jgi:predicted RNA binding protein YcfA (HicA-like mRNA interferase family)|nr:type II toxin-antitoxin system HicA family toxin [Gemmataceae bacterium]
MARLPRVTAAQVIRALQKVGFFLARQSSSHKIYRNTTGRRVTVPYHAGKILSLKTLKSILTDAGLTVEEFIRLLKDP